jgi:glutathione peroxidase
MSAVTVFFTPLFSFFMFKILFITAALFGLSMLLFSCFDANRISTRPANIATAQMPTESFYSLKTNTLDGQPADLSQYKGKKIVILNVASKCGYTPQYADWQKFFEANRDHVVVLGFPSNEFMQQEPGSADEIASFCQKNYGVTFPMFEKSSVKGSQKSPVYAWLTDPARNGWNAEEPSWNFCKYLLDEQGNLTHFFASKIKPDSPEFLVALGL